MTSVRDLGLYSGMEIDKRVLEIFKIQEQILRGKNSEIQEKDSKIGKLKDICQGAIRHIQSYSQQDHYRSRLNNL